AGSFARKISDENLIFETGLSGFLDRTIRNREKVSRIGVCLSTGLTRFHASLPHFLQREWLSDDARPVVRYSAEVTTGLDRGVRAGCHGAGLPAHYEWRISRRRFCLRRSIPRLAVVGLATLVHAGLVRRRVGSTAA